MRQNIRKSKIFLLLTILLFPSLAFATPKKKIDNVQILTGTAGGTWLAIGAAISEKVNEHFEGFPFTAVPGPGSVANPLIVGNGEADFGLSYPLFLVSAVEGKGPYDKPMSSLRAIGAMPATVLHIIVDPEKILPSSLEELLVQKTAFRLGLPPKGAGSYMIFESIFNAYGLQIEDINQWGGSIYYAVGGGLNDAWRDRIIDGNVGTYNVPAAILSEAVSSRKGKFLNVGDALMSKLLERGFSEYHIPKDTYPNQNEEIRTVGLPMILFTRDDVDEEIVYALTQSICENADFMKTVHSSFKNFDPLKMHQGNAIKLHPGAIRYYTERGLM